MLRCSAKRGGNKAILVAGPTASGKSGAAIALARKINGVVVNADSMQVWRDVPTLTARPSAADCEKADHRLYGFLEPAESFSVAKWLDVVVPEIGKIHADGRIPVVTGGTGLYFQALCEGLSPVPETDPAVRRRVAEQIAAQGFDAFLKDFQRRDPSFAFTDPQRVARAAEVLEQTGQSITEWQKRPPVKKTELDCFGIFINPPRPVLYERCEKRFDAMMRGDVFSEIEALLAKDPPENAPVMKAIGVRELTDFKNGAVSRETAVERAKQATRNYAKRQVTWFSHRFKADFTLEDDKIETILTNVLHFLS